MKLARVDGEAWSRIHVDPGTVGVRRFGTVIVLAVIGVVLLSAALVATRTWFDQHFLPSLFLPRRWYVVIYSVVRWSMVAGGLVLVFGATTISTWLTAQRRQHIVPILAAAALAFAASELTLSRRHFRPTEWLFPEEEPLRQLDPRLGWKFVPARIGYAVVAGRTIEYALDPSGYRVKSADERVDPQRPTILFTGESVMFGEGLTWEESVPAQVGVLMQVQSANLAVHGYSTDQAYLRLQTELPHFRQPIAVVTLFMPALFGRNLDDDRPHLGPGLTWLPAEHHAHLMSLAKLIVPYRRNETVERGVAVTREVLRATVELARARGAAPLIVVPQLGREEPVETRLRQQILDESRLPYALVELDPEWRLAWDRHPNASAAKVIAGAIASRLQSYRTDATHPRRALIETRPRPANAEIAAAAACRCSFCHGGPTLSPKARRKASTFSGPTPRRAAARAISSPRSWS
jgi:hypothetical protein